MPDGQGVVSVFLKREIQRAYQNVALNAPPSVLILDPRWWSRIGYEIPVCQMRNCGSVSEVPTKSFCGLRVIESDDVGMEIL